MRTEERLIGEQKHLFGHGVLVDLYKVMGEMTFQET